jgi:hypothetical protein
LAVLLLVLDDLGGPCFGVATFRRRDMVASSPRVSPSQPRVFLMSEQEPKLKNRRLHMAFAIGILVGAIIMLVAMEVASLVGGKPEAQPQPPAPAAP